MLRLQRRKSCSEKIQAKEFREKILKYLQLTIQKIEQKERVGTNVAKY